MLEKDLTSPYGLFKGPALLIYGDIIVLASIVPLTLFRYDYCCFYLKTFLITGVRDDGMTYPLILGSII